VLNILQFAIIPHFLLNSSGITTPVYNIKVITPKLHYQ